VTCLLSEGGGHIDIAVNNSFYGQTNVNQIGASFENPFKYSTKKM
jgi:hypothetical protein